MYILGISAYYHDSAACLLKDGNIIAAAQQERFSRVKNDERFPADAIRYCLLAAGINLSDVQHVVFYEKPFLKFERLLETTVATAPRGLIFFLKYMPLWLREKLFQKRAIIRELKAIDSAWNAQSISFTHHHQAHAASAFFPSPYKKALILCADGVGEWTTTSAWMGDGNTLTLLKEIRFPHSLGLLYSAFTYYLGFKVNSDEYKVMGLAPYGQPIYRSLILEKLIHVQADGSFRLNMKYFNYTTGLSMTNRHFNNLFGRPQREAGEPVNSFHMNIASSVQRVTEHIMLLLVKDMLKEYGIKNMCLAGGVALNCVANGRLLKESGIESLWVQPAAGDAGGALGAACYMHYHYLKNKRLVNKGDAMNNALLGPAYTTAQVKAELDKAALTYTIYTDDDFCTEVARLISEGKVVGWFDGRMEFGPRALGGRSILADARNLQMQSTVNLKVKFRESFRPFAPAILEEHAREYFDIKQSSPYMQLADKIKEPYRENWNLMSSAMGFEKLMIKRSPFPAATHIDYSSRLQTVNAGNGKFYKLLKAFYNLTGCPAVINTSFNVMNQPIVCTPADAIRCYLGTGIDVLAIENILVIKQ